MLKILLLLLFVTSSSISHEQPPFITILGVGQDAGYPQAGCYAKHCMPGWQDVRLKRGAVSLGLVDPVTKKKYMFEATPSFPSQLYDLEVIAPSAEYELAGIFITHAHIGHYAGLMFLGHEAMGASSIAVYAMPRLKKFLTDNGPWEQLVKYKNIILKPLEDEQSKTFGRVKITPFLVPHRDEYSETVGYKIQGPNKSALFIPDINKWDKWDENLAEQIKSVDYALIDAAFYADGELPGRDMSKIPHPFVSETMHLLNVLDSKQRNKIWFIHMNHTNPLLNLYSKESKYVISQGYNISKEGIQLDL
jgi:pyrroloquinoline quinone biosynthesis protein B